jgi:hypothetical protein
MDNLSLIQSFIKSAISGKSTLIANSELRIEPIGDTLQLWAKQEGMVSSSRPTPHNPSVILKDKTHYWPILHNVLLENSFLPIYPAPSKGFYQYEFAKVPPNYEVNYSDGLLLLQAWWQYQRQEDKSGLLGMLIWHNRTWFPIRNIDCIQGTLKILSWGDEISVLPSERVVWLLKVDPEQPQSAEAPTEEISSELESKSGSPSLISSSKFIGNYLLEAGLLSAAQVDVILSDQSSTGMRFGEIAVSRGWLKEQTIEYLMKHLISPQRSGVPLEVDEPQSVPTEPPERPSKPAKEDESKPSPKSIHDRETLVIMLRDLEDEL